jgi:hypothetical protein
MSMSGKTFLAAFQVGSNLVPDAIDGAIKRGKLDAEKVALELQNKVKQKETERLETSNTELKAFKDGWSKIKDVNSPEGADQLQGLMKKHLFGISQYKPNLDTLTGELKMLDQFTGLLSTVNSDIQQKKILRMYKDQNPAEMLDFSEYLSPNGDIDFKKLPTELKQKVKDWYYKEERFSELRAKSLIPKDVERGIFGGLTSEEKGDLRTSLKDVKKEKTVAQYVQSRQAFDQIKTLVNRAEKEGRSLKGPQDISIVFKFMKALDPESVVREGEFATAADAGGLPVKVANLANKIFEGQLLTPELRDSFIEAARDAVEGKKTQAVSTVQSYIGENEKLLPLVKDVPRYFEDILKQIESPLVEVDSKTKKKIPTVVPEDIGPFVNEEEANIYLKGLIKEGKPLPFAVQVGGKIIKVPAAERVNNKLAQQPSQASIAQGADDLEARKKEIEKELQKYKGSTVDTENKKRLESELVDVDAALRNLKQAKDPDASTSQKN